MTKHAVDRMLQREIPPEEIDIAMRFAKKTEAPRNAYFFTHRGVIVVVAKTGQILTTYRKR
jgi:hypothetical protein